MKSITYKVSCIVAALTLLSNCTPSVIVPDGTHERPPVELIVGGGQ